MNVKECVEAKCNECGALVVEALGCLEDARCVKHESSKDVLLNRAETSLSRAASTLKAVKNTISAYMVPSNAAVSIDIKQTLKEVGLKDMDDPTYGVKASDAKTAPYQAVEFPLTSQISKEDVDALGLSIHLDKESYDSLPTQNELKKAAKAYRQEVEAKAKKISAKKTSREKKPRD